MRCAIMLHTYTSDAPLLEPCTKSLESVFTKYPEHEFEIVLVEDARHPIPAKFRKKLKKYRILQTSTPRQGNLKSWAWIYEQVRCMVAQAADVVFKVDPDTLVTDLRPFLYPFEQGFVGMVGHRRTPECIDCLGACYAIHHRGLELLNADIQELWNTEWMDTLMDHMRTLAPSFGDFLPAAEDTVISSWFHIRHGLHVLPSTTFELYEWNAQHTYKDAPVVLLGNPGPACPDKDARRRMIALEFEKTIPIRPKKR